MLPKPASHDRPPSLNAAFPYRALAITAAALLCTRGEAQPSPAGSRPLEPDSASSEMPGSVLAELRGIEDFSFSFAQPGFYAMLEFVKGTDREAGQQREPTVISDWRILLERPAEFRGLPITVEGVAGRNSSWRFTSDAHRHLGTVWQLELRRAGQPIACTAILTEDASDIPLGATLRVTGYFVMIRSYYSESNRLRQAALLVAHGPTLISRAATRPGGISGSFWFGAIGAATLALAVVWLILRKSAAMPHRHVQPLHASRPAPESLADELSVWAEREALESSKSPDADTPEANAPPSEDTRSS